jgi:hypothetical protein
MPSLVEELVLLAIEDDGDIAPAAGHPGFGMALLGACLVELCNAGRLDAELGAVLVLDATPTGHPALDDVLNAVATGEPATVAQWILRLSADATTVVRQTLDALLARQVLRFEEARYLWVLKERRYPLRDGREQQDAKLRIVETLLGEQLPTPHDSVLLGLAHAAGLLEGFLSTAEIARLEDRMAKVAGLDLVVRGVEAAIREDQAERARAMMMPMY